VTPDQITPYIRLALHRYEAMVRRPRSARAWRALAIRLHCAAIKYEDAGYHGIATACSDRARDSRERRQRAIRTGARS
jgi:hypothetical protein